MPDKVKRAINEHKGALAVAGVFLLFAIVLPLVFLQDFGEEGPSPIPWQPYSAQAVAEAQAAHKPVMIDFYADWCGPCHVLDKKVFSRKDVAEAAARFVALRADMTYESRPEVKELAEKYAIFGYPTVVFIDSDGKEPKLMRLNGVEPAPQFIQRLNAVK